MMLSLKEIHQRKVNKVLCLQLIRKLLRVRELSRGQLLDRSSYQSTIKPLKQAEVFNSTHIYTYM